MDSLPLPSWSLYVLLVPAILFSIWHMNASLFPPPPPPATILQNKRIILLTAHPDDESMFFAPTLLGLTRPQYGNHIKILCLSTGNADGLGETRKQELEVAGLKLGLRKREDVLCIDDPSHFKDGMAEEWDEKVIADLLAQLFAPESLPAAKAKNKKKGGVDEPKASIDVLVTFDGTGVSGHANHKALYGGAKRFIKDLMDGYSGYASPVTLYSLTSVGLVRKYSMFLDMMPTYILGVLGDIKDGFKGVKETKHRGIARKAKGNRVAFMSDIEKYLAARDAMVNGHKSQMAWFRWGWISVGRYMFVNDLKREFITGG